MTEPETIAPWRPRDLVGLLALDQDQVLEGYRDGLDGGPEPGDNRSPAYRQGWRSGTRDAGRAEHDWLDRELARVWLAWIGSVEGRDWLERKPWRWS